MEGKSPFPLDVLEFNLENRNEFIKDHDEEMKYICSALDHYYEDLSHAIELSMSHSVASHLTYTLVLTLAKGLTSLTIYEYVRGAYLIKDDYDTIYEVWESVDNSANKIIPLLAQLEEENYFDEDVNIDEFITDIVAPQCKMARGSERLLNLQRRVALKTGRSLSFTLNSYLRYLIKWLSELKLGIYTGIEEEYDRVYWANYKMYKQEYWPKEGRSFRAHIEKYMPRYEKLTPDYLARLLWDEQNDFMKNETGQLWRDFFEEKKDLYIEAKHIIKDDEQWKYFFKCICRFEEYDRWIDELKNPPSNGGDIEIPDNTTIGKKIAAFFNDGTLKVEKPHQLYFLLLAMWARHLLSSKEMTSFVRTVRNAYPALYKVENDSDWTKIVTSLQNMNGKANKYFDEVITDQATMIEYIDLMYPKKNNGERRKETQSAVDLANKLFLGLK